MSEVDGKPSRLVTSFLKLKSSSAQIPDLGNDDKMQGQFETLGNLNYLDANLKNETH